MAKDYSIYSKDQLINRIVELEKQLRNNKYGLYWDRGIEEEKILKYIKTNIPFLIRIDDRTMIGENKRNNLLIEGDNYPALLALASILNGKIDVIYIDPPYNTGRKDFIYNDKCVDIEDGYKHTKWLNFMEKRLRLAKDLIKDDGIIFISIDEHEFAQLKLLCDHIFGEANFVENFIWIKNSTKNLSATTSTNHEYIFAYAKNINSVAEKKMFRIEKPGFKEVNTIVEEAIREGLGEKETEKKLKQFFKLCPNLKGISMYNRVEYSKQRGYLLYTLSDLSAPKATGIGQMYDVIHPNTGKPCKTPSRGWGFTHQTMEEHIKNNNIYFYEDETKVPRFKRYLNDVTTEIMKSIIIDNTDGKKELARIFQTAPFNNAKPTTLIRTLLSFSTKNSIILDFFAGSGTTGQAVLELNKEDGGNRRFILCTNNENNICTDVTYPRLKTVITGIRPDGTKYSEGIPANLIYYKTDFIKDSNNTDQAKYNLVEKIDELLCISEDTFKKLEKNAFFSHYSSYDETKHVFIYSEIYRKEQFELLKFAVNMACGEKIIYIFSNDNNIDPILLKELGNVIVKPVPSKIYEIYKETVEDIKRGEQ